jgi:hypothetical protein
VALRAGDCLVVAPIGEASRVPRGIFRERAAAFGAAFAFHGGVRGRRGAQAVVGLLLEPDRLFSSGELARATAILERERAQA